jgi:multiple sugar transport system ATP-binding protein
VTTVYVTHDQVEAMTMGERIVVLKGGEVQQQGAPLEVYDRPANPFVAEFIGSPAMNLLAAEVVAGETRGLRIENTVLPLTDAARGPLRAEAYGGIVLGIRPEHLRLCDENGIPARVVLVERTGSDTLIHTPTGHNRVVVRAGDVQAPEIGTGVHLRVDLEHARFFDRESQLRIEVAT